MPCWVAPVVAAEMWGVSLAEVAAKVADGSLPSKTEAGFQFVDLLAGAASSAAIPAAPAEAPQTFVAVSAEEMAALAEPDATPAAPLVTATIKYAEDDDEERSPQDEPFVDEETPDFSAKDWRRVRAQTARTRRPPGGASAGASAIAA